jgi:hypothetical protein
MEISYRPTYNWFRIECTRDEYQAILDGLHLQLQNQNEKWISTNDIDKMNKVLASSLETR